MKWVIVFYHPLHLCIDCLSMIDYFKNKLSLAVNLILDNMDIQPRWVLKSFAELTTEELYQILQKRQDVFILEQNCHYPDLDDKDRQTLHLLGYVENRLIAYARLFPSGMLFENQASFGRVLVVKDSRRLKLGKKLVQEIIRVLEHDLKEKEIKIEAQLYLQKFYEEFGFIAEGKVFLDAGIDHIMMSKII